MKTNMRITTLFVSVALATTACSTSDVPDGAALEHIAERSHNDARERPYDSIDGLAELITDRHDRGEGNELIVVGQVTAVEEGTSFRWELTDDGERRIQLPYGSDESMANTVHLTFDVTETLAPHNDTASQQLTIGLAVSPGLDLSLFENDYLGLGEVVMFLEASPVFDYQSGLYGIIDDGQLMATVDEAGTLSFPILDDQNGLLDGKPAATLDSIRSDHD